MPTIEDIEDFLVTHTELIDVAAVFAVVVVALAAAIVAYMSVRELRRQCVFQEWAVLRNIAHDCQLRLFDFRAKARSASDEEGVVLDEAIAALENLVQKIEDTTCQIEHTLSIAPQASELGVRKR